MLFRKVSTGLIVALASAAALFLFQNCSDFSVASYLGKDGGSSRSHSLDQQLTLQSTSTASVQAVGQFEIVFNHSTDACEDGDIPDTAAHAFRDASGNVNLTVSHYVGNYRSSGPSLDSLQHVCKAGLVSAADTKYVDDEYHEWIAAPYTLDGTNVIGLVHNEWYPPLINQNCTGGWVNSVTLVTSSDSGQTYSHPADYKVRVPGTNWSSSFSCDNNDPNVAIYGSFLPSGIVDGHDGYYYSFFRAIAAPNGVGSTGVCLLRSQSLSTASAWTVLTDSGWQQANQTAQCKTIAFQPFDWPGWLSVKYSTYFNKYLALLDGGPSNGGPRLYYSLSDDLINWSTAIPLALDPSIGVQPAEYWSLLDPTDSSRNFDNIGQEPYIYFTSFVDNDMNRNVVRQKIHFDSPNALSLSNFNNTGGGIIVSNVSGKCLDLTGGSSDDGTLIQQWDCNNQANQQWNFYSNGSEYYQIRSPSSGKCADIKNLSLANGAPLQQWDCADPATGNQLFKKVDVGNGNFMLTVENSGKCLEVASGNTDNGVVLIQDACSASKPAQLFQLPANVVASAPGAQPATAYGAVTAAATISCDEFNPDAIKNLSTETILWLASLQPSGITLHENYFVARQAGYTGAFGAGQHLAYLAADPTRQTTFTNAINAFANQPIPPWASVGAHHNARRAAGYAGLFMCGGDVCFQSGQCDNLGRRL